MALLIREQSLEAPRFWGVLWDFRDLFWAICDIIKHLDYELFYIKEAILNLIMFVPSTAAIYLLAVPRDTELQRHHVTCECKPTLIRSIIFCLAPPCGSLE